MSDQTANGPAQKHRRVPRVEYRIYFAAIFVAALPFTFAACLADLVTGHETKDPVRRALAEARAITPHIFSA
jgi:hypothetical protein